jgi:hypothetical protein
MKQNKQHERQQRGENFQDEMRRSWKLLPNCWRMRIADGGGSTRPADTLVLLRDRNILAEYKRTDGEEFKLGMLEVNQQTGLIDFEATQIPGNMGMVFVSFYNEAQDRDETYGFRLIPALEYMKANRRLSVPLEVFRAGGLPAFKCDLIDDIERTWNLQEVYNLCK